MALKEVDGGSLGLSLLSKVSIPIISKNPLRYGMRWVPRVTGDVIVNAVDTGNMSMLLATKHNISFLPSPSARTRLFYEDHFTSHAVN